MFDQADPILARVRTLALAFPDAAEKISHGHPAFYTTKVFAYYGGSVKVDGVYQRHEQSLLVLLDPAERAVLSAEDRCYVPAYLLRCDVDAVDLSAGTDPLGEGEGQRAGAAADLEDPGIGRRSGFAADEVGEDLAAGAVPPVLLVEFGHFPIGEALHQPNTHWRLKK